MSCEDGWSSKCALLCVRSALLAAFSLMLATGLLSGDEVEMLDGRHFTGKVLAETEDAIRFSINFPGGSAEMRFRKAKVHALTVGGRRRVINEKPREDRPSRTKAEEKKQQDDEGEAPQKKDDAGYWVGPMKQVRAKFTGRKGTFAHFGDSITVTMAFWTGLQWSRKNMSPEATKAYELVNGYMLKECWGNWKGPKYGNQGTMTIRWAHRNIDAWLKDLNPEAALIMFGTNDLNKIPFEDYVKETREVIQKCLENGTVVILSTIPPKHGMAERAAQYAEAVRGIAKEMKVPLSDFHAEIMKRRPEDWDGRLDKFSEYSGYDVPTLLARDGVHPSNSKPHVGDYSEEGLKNNGFTLRNYVTLLKYAEVITKVLAPEASGQGR
jgi:lysophospholipase L1-like esterase